jgi:glucokinase
MSARTVLAVDLGGTKLAVALVDQDGAIQVQARVAVQRTSVGATAAQIAALAAQLAEPEGVKPAALGCIVPGIVRPTDGAAWAPNLWGGEFRPLGEELEARLGGPIVLESDRTGHLLGEAWLGAARGASDAVFVAVGTGIGVGILTGGRVVRGSQGIAGAAGWLAMREEWHEEYAACGCYEWEAAGPAVERLTREATGADAGGEALFKAAEAGERWACDAIAGLGRVHGRAIADLVSLLNPEVVVLGGGLMTGAHWFLETIQGEVARWAQPVAALAVRIVPSALGPDAGLLGAARLALDPAIIS